MRVRSKCRPQPRIPRAQRIYRRVREQKIPVWIEEETGFIVAQRGDAKAEEIANALSAREKSSTVDKGALKTGRRFEGGTASYLAVRSDRPSCCGSAVLSFSAQRRDEGFIERGSQSPGLSGRLLKVTMVAPTSRGIAGNLGPSSEENPALRFELGGVHPGYVPGERQAHHHLAFFGFLFP